MIRFPVLAIFSLVLAGCSGPKLVERISGEVAIDDAPVGNCIITFWPRDDLYLGSFTALVDDQGAFDIVVDPEKCPAQPGRYDVAIRAPLLPIRADLMTDAIRERLARLPRIPAPFTNPRTSGTSVDVAVGANRIDIGFSH